MVVYLLSIRHGGSLLSGPSAAVIARYGAIPYALSHPSSHCALLSSEGYAGLKAAIACSVHPGAIARQLQAPLVSEARTLPAWQTIFTSMFVNANLLQVGANMVALSIFAPSVEDRLGALRFLALYLLGGVVALAAQVGAAGSATSAVVGASGAIGALLGAYILLFPRARMLTLVFILFFFTIVELPAGLLLALWLAWQVVEAQLSAAGGGGAAILADFGSLLFGALLIRALPASRARPRTQSPAYHSSCGT